MLGAPVLKVVLEPRAVTITPGGETVPVKVHVFNLSRVVDAYTIGLDRPPRWLRAPSTEVRLLPGTDEQVELHLAIPRGPLVFAQTIRVSVWVRSEANPAVGYQTFLEVTVPVVEAPVTLRLDPSLLRVRSGATGSLAAVVDNRAGNGPLSVKLQGQDPEGAIGFTFDPPVLQVPPGQEARAKVTLRAEPPEAGQNINRPFTITGTAGERAFPSAGTYVQSTPAAVVDAPVALRIEPSVIRVVDSDTGNFAAVVDNRGGSRWVRVGLKGSDPERALKFTFAPSVIDVPPGRQVSTAVQVRGVGPAPGKESSRQLTVHGVDGKSEFSTTATFVQVSSPPALSQLSLKLDPAILRLRDSAEGRFRLIADNRDGTKPVRVQLWGQDPERAIRFNCYPPVLDVPAGGTATAQIQALAPLPEPSQEITRQITISGSDGNRTVEATGSMIITTSAPAIEVLSVRLDPTVARSQNGRTGFFQAVIDNRTGHHPIRVYLGGDDPENVVGFVFTPAVLDIGPGQLAAAQVRVEAPRPDAGQEVSRQITVLASDGYREVSTSGSFVQVAAARKPIAWILFTLFGGLAMIAGAFFGWAKGEPDVTGIEWNIPLLERTFNFDLNLMDQIANVTSAGAIAAVLGLLAILGLTGQGRLTRAASLVGLAGMVGFLIALAVSNVNGMPQTGSILVIAGSVSGFIGGVLTRK